MIWEYTVLTALLLQCCKEFTNLFWSLLILLQLPDAGYFWEPPAPARGGGKPMWSVGLDAVGSYNQQPRYVAVRGEGISLTISIHKQINTTFRSRQRIWWIDEIVLPSRATKKQKKTYQNVLVYETDLSISFGGYFGFEEELVDEAEQHEEVEAEVC